jgi:hypothetical protein
MLAAAAESTWSARSSTPAHQQPEATPGAANQPIAAVVGGVARRQPRKIGRREVGSARAAWSVPGVVSLAMLVLRKRRLLYALIAAAVAAFLGSGTSADARRAAVIKIGSARIYSAPVKVRPRLMTFGADGREIYSHLAWSSWGGPIASASGVFEVNFRAPGSAYLHFATVVEATDLETCDGRPAYTEIWQTTERSVSSQEPHRMNGFSIAEGWHRCRASAASRRINCGAISGQLAPGQQGETWSFFRMLATGTTCDVVVGVAKQFGPLSGSTLGEGRTGAKVDGFTCWDLERAEFDEPRPTSRCVRRGAEILLYNGGD